MNGNGVWDPGDDLAYIDYGGMFGSAGGRIISHGSGTWCWERSDDLRKGALRRPNHRRSVANHHRWPKTLVAVASLNGTWANGQNIFDAVVGINNSQNNELWSDHNGGVNVAFCDGSVRFLSETMSTDVLFALCTRAGGEPIPNNGF